MSRVFSFLLLAMFSGSAASIDIYCSDRKSLDRVEMLDSAYENAKIVFLANVEIEHLDEAPHLRWKYSIITPVLKGEVKNEGYLYPNTDACKTPDLSEKAVFLVFLNDQKDVLTPQNTLMVVYNRGNAHEDWALKWAESKAHNNHGQ